MVSSAVTAMHAPLGRNAAMVSVKGVLLADATMMIHATVSKAAIPSQDASPEIRWRLTTRSVAPLTDAARTQVTSPTLRMTIYVKSRMIPVRSSPVIWSEGA